MALQSKTYTRSTETLFDILEAICAGLVSAGELSPKKLLKMDINDETLEMSCDCDSLNTIRISADLDADGCIVTIIGDGAWWTAVSGALDTAFGV